MKVAIIAHGSAQQTFDRHLKYWEALDPRLSVYCPADDAVNTSHTRILSGNRGRATGDSIKRLRKILKDFLETEEKFLVIFEYDSICLEPEWLQVDEGILYGNAMMNLDPRFIAPRYLNPPWMMSRDVAFALDSAADRYPSIFETGEVDRWISAMAHLAGVPMLDFSPRGFTRGTIGHEHLPEMFAAIYDGASMIHGLKHGVLLDRAVTYSRLRTNRASMELEMIYAAGGWDGQGSGPGSSEEFTRAFRKWLADVIDGVKPEQIVDLGCGDWQWQQHMDWPTYYTGVDVVRQVIDRNKAKWTLDYITFVHQELLQYAWKMKHSPAHKRLVIVKDVLHHLTELDADRLLFLMADEPCVVWVVDTTDSGQAIGPSGRARERYLDPLPMAFEFERPASYRYGRKVVLLQRKG